MFLFISQFTIKLATKAQRTDRPFGSRAFAVFGPMCWNSLPSALKSSSVQCATLSEQFWITEDDSYGAGVVIIPTADLFFFSPSISPVATETSVSHTLRVFSAG